MTSPIGIALLVRSMYGARRRLVERNKLNEHSDHEIEEYIILHDFVIENELALGIRRSCRRVEMTQ